MRSRGSVLKPRPLPRKSQIWRLHHRFPVNRTPAVLRMEAGGQRAGDQRISPVTLGIEGPGNHGQAPGAKRNKSH